MLLHQLDAELDDQDRVLRLQADEHHQADLAEDVERHVVEPEPDHRAEGRQGDRQDDDQRPDPALVEGRHEQEDADDRQGEDVGRHVAGLLLLVGRAGPLVAEALGQDLGGHRLHRGDRLARAVARGGLAGDPGGGVHVVVRHVDRPERVLDLAQGAQGHLVALVVQDVQAGDVLGPVAVAGLGLDHDLPGLAVEVEVVDVVGPEVGLEDAEDVGDGDVEAAGLDPVDVEPELRAPGPRSS